MGFTKTIIRDNKVLAVITNVNEIDDERKFITPENFPLQVGIHNRKNGDYIKAHEHLPFASLGDIPCQEVIYVVSGKICVRIYHKGFIVGEETLTEGEVIILNSAHSIRMYEDAKILEVKQGYYRGKENDKRYLE